MKSRAYAMLPPQVRRALKKLGVDIALARRKRGLTITMMLERLGVAKQTYQRVERGDASVSVGIYAMALFALGLGDTIGQLADAGRDTQGLLLDQQRVPKRVRRKSEPTPR